MNFGNKIGAEKAPFPMTSMIDILFITLIFFITTSIYAQFEAEIGINVPKSTAGETVEREPFELIINISTDGKFIINQVERPLVPEDGKPESIRTMLERIAELCRQRGTPPHIIIRAAKDTMYENVIKVLTECKNAEIENVSFAVIREEN